MKRLQFCLVVFAVLALSFSAFAQVQNGQFTGTVTDPTGAAIANAKISVTNPATDLNVSTTTNSSGNYAVKELPIGSYKLTVEAAGFKTVSNSGVQINAGTISHVDFKLQIGKASEVIEVSGEAAAVNTEDSKLATTVSSTQINNLPLNGRNVFDLMQLSTGAVNVNGVDFENGHGTVVNGVREDFNGFLINGVSNKGLSGGVVNVPIEDSVEEFQQLQLNMSAQYGNSAGGTVNLVTKSGTNAWHGSAWEYLRNDATDANQFFLNQSGIAKSPVRFNQFGFTLGGPIMKDKLFFFLSMQGDRFKSNGNPININQESQAWRDAVVNANAASGLNSTAALLYSTFPTHNPGTTTGLTANTYFPLQPTTNTPDYTNAVCQNTGMFGGYTQLQRQKLVSIFGVTAQDIANINADNAISGNPQCTSIPSIQTGSLMNVTGGRDASIQESSVATFGTQTQTLGGNLFNGNEASLRLDYNWNANNRFYINYNYNRQTDKFGPSNIAATRGFGQPTRNNFPAGTLSFVHSFSPSILNEFRAGYLQNNTDISVSIGGVPQIHFSDPSSVGFGSYNGYPQNFKENIYTYSDMVSIGHGNHNFKIGADFRRNIENSEFNVGRSSYYFYDQVGFAADAPYYQAAGVDPGICKSPCPVSSYNPAPASQLSTNIRHWRNLEFGAYFQDDWKVTKRLTLNLGLRYDLYQRHKEEANYATTFILGPSTANPQILGPSNGLLNELFNANNPATCDPTRLPLAQLAGGCSATAGGFAPSASLGQGDHNNFGPRVGFAWDVFGNGKTALRGGFGVAYEGTLYNPLSNSRWNLPYYSFNGIQGGSDQLAGSDVIYGPTTYNGTVYAQDPTKVPTFTGNGSNPGNSGPPSQAQNHGNIEGWDPGNPNLALLTGIIFPSGVRDPYVYNFYLDVQHEIMPKTIIDLKYVGTAGHKLFRAEDVNRQPGSSLPSGVTVTDSFGRTLTGLGGRLNGNYGRLRVWENQVNSNYNSLQASLKRQMSHGLLFNLDYTYSHSIDDGSTWHSGATTANGAAGGEGFTTDQTIPGLDRGNSIYDIRHRLVFNYVWQLPGQNLKGVAGVIAGGWNLNGIWQFQSGAHWEPFASSSSRLRELALSDSTNNPNGHCEVTNTYNDFTSGNCTNYGGDFNLDSGKNDRPNSTVSGYAGGTHSTWANGLYNSGFSFSNFSTPCLGCSGTLGRNSFVGPGNWFADMTLSKTFKLTERVSMKFDANAFNVFNRANFVLATAGGGANNKYASPAPANVIGGLAMAPIGNFGQAAGTLNAREMQFGVKFSF
ncbi:MAG: TonB-dependent receptor [Acidobacteriia bacterium]|nr:TonB-dependent receptor [Terriglobia bacterium]